MLVVFRFLLATMRGHSLIFAYFIGGLGDLLVVLQVAPFFLPSNKRSNRDYITQNLKYQVLIFLSLIFCTQVL